MAVDIRQDMEISNVCAYMYTGYCAVGIATSYGLDTTGIESQ